MNKSPEAFRSISEAAEEVGVPQHVLRFWETKFSFIRPMKRSGGRRFYRPQDIQLLRAVHSLLHVRGLTIRGVQLLQKSGGVKRLLEALDPSMKTLNPEDFEPATTLSALHISEDARFHLERVADDLDRARSALDLAIECVSASK